MMSVMFMESILSAVVRNGSYTGNPQGFYYMFMSLGIIMQLLLMLFVFVIWLGMIVFLIAMTVICIISYWKIFTKAGQPGYAAIIPFYNMYILAEMVFGKGIYCLFFLAGFLPAVGQLLMMLYIGYQGYQLGRVFHKSSGFIIGLILVPIVFLPMLALGHDEYDPDMASFIF